MGTWPFPGYEPKRFTGQMSEFHRRRATKEEMEQGQKEIRLADERMKTEAESRGEMPIQNGPEEKPEDVVEGETSPPKEGKRDEPQRGTPARNSNQGSGAKALLPPTQPPPDPPALSLRQEVVNSLEKNTPADKGEGNFNGGPLMREIATPPEQQAGDDANQVQGQSMAPPLFTEEQLRNFAALQGQAAWMYGPQQSFFNPIGFSRPSFLDGDAARASVSQHERDMEFLRMQAVRDREEKDECRRQIQLLVEENRQLRARFESASKMQTEDEPRFATPEEQPDQTSPGFDMDVDWLKRRKEADRPPSKEADRPPSKEADRPPSKEADRPPSKEAARPPFLPEAAEFKTPKEAARPPKVEASQRPQEEGSRGAPGGGNAQFTEKSLEFMVIMMETMKDLHKKVNETKDETGMVRGVEIVRSGTPDLPVLTPWSPSQGPLQLGDWLLTVEPIIADLSATSEVWWSLMVKSAEQWYQKHMMMPPLDRVQHEVQPPPEVTLEKWSRLERRTASMLLQSVPEVVKEELVSARRLSVFGILTQLLLTYCPGGVLEKQTLLRSLEEPTEVTTVGEAPAAIRRWLRWKLRSQEIGAVTPDPALLLKGLNKLTRRVLESNKELQFRVSLARNSLGVDTRPTDTTVSQFATHLLAEIEQVALSEKRATAAMPKGEVKIKYLDADKNKPKTKERSTEEDKPKPKCRFFLTDAGCKRGKECTFSHDVKDDRRRCYNCGSVDHLSPSCTRSKGASTETSPNKPRVAKAEGEERNVTSPMKESETGSQSSQGEAVKDLLEEANRMLKSLSSSSNTTASTTSSTSEEERKDVMERLHQQLKSMKTFKMKRLNVGNDVGLVDSGATHPLRPRHEGENVDLYPVVEVALADGRTVRLKMSPGGAMISPSPAIEPIIPMGLLSQKLNCDISWKQGSMQIHHPLRGEIKVMMKGSCPHVARSEALTLIAELEDIKMGIPNEIGSFDAEVAWLRKLVSQHPVLSSLPEHIKERLVVEPGTWSDLPGNRHSRKRWKRSGLAVHLYAGPETGFTLRHAIKQLGGSVDALLEVDVQRGEQHDMLSDHAVYRGLLRVALEGKINAIVGGPNCRTRSLLRHIPIPGQPSAPRPIRRWGGEEFGIHDATEEEKQKLHEDDVLMWRFWFLYMVAVYMRRARKVETEVTVSVEQPATPKEFMPEVVSWWDTKEWAELAREFSFEESTFKQGELGGLTPKPTTFGGNLELYAAGHQRRCRAGERVSCSSQLSRWAPGVMSMVASALIRQVEGPTFKGKAMSWSEHLAFRHVPYRRDCRVCQESSQQCPPHRLVKDPIAGVLSIDTAGPLKPAYDLGGHMARYFLVGVLTWRVPKGSDKMQNPPEEAASEGAPEIEEGAEDPVPPGEDGLEAEELLPAQLPGEAPAEGEPGDAPGEDGLEGHADLPVQLPGEAFGPPTLDEVTELRRFRMALPMGSKKARDVVNTVMEFVLRLRTEGFHVGRIHSDQGHEFAGEFKTWARQRGIYLTKTPGDDPAANGRAEMAVKDFKNQIRRTLRQASEDAKWWPWALRYVNEVYRCVRMETRPSWPRFLEEVRVRKRTWRRDDLDPRVEKVQYLCPSVENHGHWVIKEGEAPRLTRYILAPTTEPEDETVWIAVEREGRDAQEQRRRIRGRSAVRRMDASVADPEEVLEEKEKAEVQRLMKVVEDEMQSIINDDPDLAAEEVRILGRLRKMAEVKEDGDEILQTKVISPKEVVRNWSEWIPSVRSEVESLTIEKAALKELSKDEVKALKKKAEKEGKKLEIIPSKLVFTVKPSPDHKEGKKKTRWVVCGNYEEKKEGEENYSGGADATSLRLLAWIASRMKWAGCILDVRTAFLNAQMEQEPDEDLLLVQPPHILKEMKFLDPDTLYLPLKAVYGFRRSPKLWGLHRDKTIKTFDIKVVIDGRCESLELKPMESEQNLWKVVVVRGGFQEAEEEWISNGRVIGLVMTYVDDIFIVAEKQVAKSVAQKFQETWATTQPEWVGETPVRFLGLEVTCHQIEGEEKVQWCLSQEAYIKDLLGRYEEEGKPRKLPITRDQASMPPDVIPPSPEGVKFSQKVIGELLWLVTRSRPDLMFGVSRMGANVLKAANCIKDTAAQMRSYLRRTAGEGLQYKQKIDDPITLYVYSDSSFAPEADESHGSFVVMVNDGLMFWRSGRQGTITLSTAESELMELVEAMIAGESVYVVLAELFGEISKVALCDSQAALAILVAEGGSWRTRHLRLRWAFARQSVLRGDWQVGHVPGEKMLADLGTKVLTSSRMETLKQMMGMGVAQPEEKGVEMEKDEKKEKEIKTDSKSVATMAVKLITMAALLSVSKAQGDEEDDEPAGDFHNFMVIYTVLIILITLMVQILWKVGVGALGENWKRRFFTRGRSLPMGEETSVAEGRACAEVCGPVERPRHLPSAAGSSNQPSPAEDGLGMEEGSPVQLAVAEQRRAGEGGLGQRASVQLPASAGEGGLEGHADPPVQLPAAPAKAPPPKEGPKAPSKAGQTPKAPPKAGPKPKAAPQSGPSASSSSSGSTSSSMTGRIETAIQDIAYEEATLWDHFGRQGDFPGVPEDHSRAELGFQVLRTPCGTVYHDTRGCTQLQGPRTGYARPFTWCALCREVAMRTRGRPIPGSPLLLRMGDQTVHTDRRCPRARDATELRGCMYCTEYNG